MRTRPRMASALMLLPQPDSPTRPTVSPSSMAKLTPSTAWTAPSWLSNVTARSVTFSRLSPFSDTGRIKSFHRVFGKPRVAEERRDGRFDATRSFLISIERWQ